MSLRRLWVLVSRLPQDSAVARAQHGEAADWLIGDYLLARLNNVTMQAHASRRVAESDLIRPPDPGRPATPPTGRKDLGAADLDALFTGGG